MSDVARCPSGVASVAFSVLIQVGAYAAAEIESGLGLDPTSGSGRCAMRWRVEITAYVVLATWSEIVSEGITHSLENMWWSGHR